MTTFVEHVKEKLAIRERGYPDDKVLVDRKHLQDLLYHFQRLDHEVRREYYANGYGK